MKRTCSVLVLSLTSSLLVQCTGCGADHDEEPPPLCEPPTENLRDDCFITDEDIVHINTRADLEPFCNSRCTKLPGGLFIGGGGGLEGATDLRVFRNVRSLGERGGFLRVLHMRDLESLEGLEQLKRASSVALIGNQSLRSLEGLNNLRDTSKIYIEDNPRLISLEGLDSLNPTFEDTQFEDEDITARITIRNNDALEELDGFPVLTRSFTITIEDNAQLRRITGFEALERSEGGLILEGQPRLQTLQGAFPNLEYSWGLGVRDNPNLPQCEAEALLERVETGPGEAIAENNDPDATCEE